MYTKSLKKFAGSQKSFSALQNKFTQKFLFYKNQHFPFPKIAQLYLRLDINYFFSFFNESICDR